MNKKKLSPFIPMMAVRLGPGMDLFGTRTPLEYKHLVDVEVTVRQRKSRGYQLNFKSG